MKKLYALLLTLTMLLSLAACGGGNDLAAAAREIQEITGEKTTADDVKEAMEQLEALSGEKVTAQDVVDFTREMYEFAGGGDSGEPDDEEWPFDDIPEWPVAEGLSWEDYYGENQIDLFVSGGKDEMNAWLEELRKAGFNGYFWGADDLEYYSENYWIRLDDRGAGENEYHLVITSGDMELGFPEEIQGLFPDYNGDGVLTFGGEEDYDGKTYYLFNALGETEAGGQRYLQALKDAGFESKSDSHYSGASGYYFKSAGGQRLGYESEEYWYEFDEETGTGWADFGLTVEPE